MILVNGRLTGYLTRSSERLLTFLPREEPDLSQAQRDLVGGIVALAANEAIYIKEIDGAAVARPHWKPCFASMASWPIVTVTEGDRLVSAKRTIR